MAAATHPARRAALAVALLAAVAGCRPGVPAGTPQRPVSPAGWHAVAELRGYAVHALHPVPGGVELAGERLGDGGGVLLRYTDASGEVAEIDGPEEALQLRAMAVAEDGLRVIGGIDRNGRGLVLAGRPGSWRRVPIPDDVTQIDALAVDGPLIVASGSAGDAGVVTAGSAGGVKTRFRLAPSAGRFARLISVAVTASEVLAAGTDGRRAVILHSRDRAATFRAAAVPGAAITSLAPGDDGILAGGHDGESDADRAALLLRSDGSGWHHVTVPTGVSIGALSLRGRRGLAALATGSGDELLISSDGAVTWTRTAPGTTSQPAALEAVALGDDAAWVAGVSGLYRGPP